MIKNCTKEKEEKLRQKVVMILSWTLLLLFIGVLVYIVLQYFVAFAVFGAISSLVFLLAMFIEWISGRRSFCKEEKNETEKI